MKKRTVSIIVILLFITLLAVINYKQKPLTKTDFKLNTMVTITVYDGDEKLLNGCMEICDKYENMFSRTDENSELYMLNHGLLKKDSDGYMQVSDELYQLIQDGLLYMELTDGRFHIGMEPLTALWNFSGEDRKVPSTEELVHSIRYVNNHGIRCKSPNLVYLEEGAGIDLGATAKGYISEKVKEYLVTNGVSRAVISLGGNIVCIGEKEKETPFVIGIQKPFASRGEAMGMVEIRDAAVVSSGIYERYFEEGGLLYHHILNPKTGYPYENDIVGVTIICEDAYLADIYSTMSLILGSEDAIALLNNADGVEGMLILKDDAVLFSDGFIEKYKYQNS